MLITISTTHTPATDLGFLLHKHPDRVQTFDVAAGQAHVFYPEATESRCTAALLLEIDPIDLVRGHKFGGNDAHTLAQYVNDRPYAASSMLAVALGKVFRTALQGRCTARPELAEQEIPLEVHVPALPCRGGAEIAERLFAHLGWTVTAVAVPLDPTIAEWGDSRYVDLRLTGDLRLADALSHLYVLLPVLDNAKHYWVSPDEVDKLIRAGSGWLSTHPDRDFITRRYLAHSRSLVSAAVERLAEIDDAEAETLDDAVQEEPPVSGVPVRGASLAEARRGSVLAALRNARATRVVDLGCGEGGLLQELLQDTTFTAIVGADVSPRALELAGRRLKLDRLPDRQRDRIQLLHTSLTYRDDRIAGYDAIVLMEVIEHIDPSRLGVLERNVFGLARPSHVLVTTPNAEYNVHYESLVDGAMRHADHRFEWSRAQFQAWGDRTAERHGYAVSYLPVGDEDPRLGAPTQLAMFTRASDAEVAA